MRTVVKRFLVMAFVLLGLLVVLASAAPSVAEAETPASWCKDKDMKTDSWNCGTCGHVCQHDTACKGGVCTCPDGRLQCGGDSGLCCGEDESCSNGKCVKDCARTHTETCQTSYGPVCTDLKTNNGNCGACGHSCSDGRSCAGGKCACNEGLSACGGTCIDTQYDAQNCGACGHRCGKRETCFEGQCKVCARSQRRCVASYANITEYRYCSNVREDERNCGKCGHECPHGMSCVRGSCVL